MCVCVCVNIYTLSVSLSYQKAQKAHLSSLEHDNYVDEGADSLGFTYVDNEEDEQGITHTHTHTYIHTHIHAHIY